MLLANDYGRVEGYYRAVAHSRPRRFTNWFLRDWLAALNVRQADLADKTDLGKTAVSLLVNERQDYSPVIIQTVADFLNIAPYELLMRPSDAMALRRLRDDAIQVVENSRNLTAANDDRTGTHG